MKRLLFFLLIILLFIGCSIDNYDLPQLTLKGKIVDSETNELVESGGINAGTIVKLYEGNSSQPILLNTLPEGTFIDTRLFQGTYNYTAEGPFKMTSTTLTNIEIKTNSEVDIKVIPNVRLKATLIETGGSTVTIRLQFNVVDPQQELAQLGVVWSTMPNPNVLTFTGGNVIFGNVDPLVLSGENQFIIENLRPKTKYYVRATARTNNPGNFYNYASQIEASTK